jgi:Sec-independent protein translocase protein TatA
VGFGSEILFILILGLLLLGPERLPTILGHVARAKAQFDKATHSFKTQLEAELATQHRGGNTGSSPELAEDK